MKYKSKIITINSKINNEFIARISRIIYNKFAKKSNVYNLKGELILDNGKKKKFVIDSADSPYLFNSKDLEECDLYFKVQCPKDLDKEGFYLTPEIVIPWTDHEKDGNVRKSCENFKKNKYKIKPLMLGTRKLSNGISYSLLKKGFDNYLKSRKVNKNKKLMCYFGNSQGPIPKKVKREELDFDEESQLLGYFEKNIQHPNEKRAKAADTMSEIEPKNMYDARIINRGNSDSGGKNKNESLIIPIEDFCNHVAQFEYNLNISGYRLSIPNRFLESFISGTAILTDKLSVKWYKPFDKEVVETVPMGYLKDKDVDWEKFEEDIRSLPKVSKEEVINAFDKNWSPIAVCNYIIEELLKV